MVREKKVPLFTQNLRASVPHTILGHKTPACEYAPKPAIMKRALILERAKERKKKVIQLSLPDICFRPNPTYEVIRSKATNDETIALAQKPNKATTSSDESPIMFGKGCSKLAAPDAE